MYTAADMLTIMQGVGADQNPPTIQLGTMTGHNTCMLGDEIELSETQLYFFARDIYRMQRTNRPPDSIKFKSALVEGMTEVGLVNDSSVKGEDHSVYDKPLKEGDTVALISIDVERYLVLGKIVAGEDVKELEEQTNADWGQGGNYED